MRHSEQINELATALAKAQSVLKPAKKDAVNPHFKSQYADLAAILDVSRDPLAKNNLSVVQGVERHDGMDRLVTRLQHASGQWLEDDGVPLLGAGTMQQLGSALTYARRYGLSAVVGISAEDDDANGTSASRPPAIRADVRDDHEPPPMDDDDPSPPYERETPAPVQRRPSAGLKITDAQAKRMFAIARGAGRNPAEYRAFLKTNYGIDKDTEMSRSDYEAACLELSKERMPV